MKNSVFLLGAAKLAYVAGMIALAASGNVVGVLGVEDAKLWGVEQDAKRPGLGMKAVNDETFQRAFVTWFEQHWGLRGYAVKTDNTVVEAVFGENRRAENLVLGKNGVVLPTDDVHYVNRGDGPEPAVAAALRIARVQRKLRAAGRTLIPILVPAKTSMVREAVPDRWRRAASFARSDQNVYRAFIQTLERENAKYVDGRAILAASPEPGDTFARTARHWRISGACAVFRAAVDVARTELPELGTENVDCTTELVPNADIEDEDFDLFRLRNVWARKPEDVHVLRLAEQHAPPGSALASLSTLFEGSSFTWKLVHIARDRGVMSPSTFYYYDASVVDTTTLWITKPVIPGTSEWREDTFGKRVSFVVILESMLPGDGERFFVELENAVDQGKTGL